MGIARFLILVGIIGFGIHWWNGKGHDATAVASDYTSPNGFVSVAMPAGTPPNTVVILAPVNCPSAEAQRADSLSEQLSRRGIPNVRSSHFSASSTDPSAEQKARLDHAVAVLNGEIPAVFINGVAKANPSADEVVTEYRRTRSQ